MSDPNMINNPTKMRKEIIQLIRSPKFQSASEGRKTVKALKLPSGIVKLLNAKISVSAKKEILDKVLTLLDKRVRIDKLDVTPPKQRVREEKSQVFETEELPSYSTSSNSDEEIYFGEFNYLNIVCVSTLNIYN